MYMYLMNIDRGSSRINNTKFSFLFKYMSDHFINCIEQSYIKHPPK